jgi:hypothetical protein
VTVEPTATVTLAGLKVRSFSTTRAPPIMEPVVWPPIMEMDVELPIIARTVVPLIMPFDEGFPSTVPEVAVVDLPQPTTDMDSSTTNAASARIVPRLVPFICPPFH